MGLEVMRHRAHVIGASLEIDSKFGKGVTVTCTVPLEEHEH
jgi:signal transduction histidine kinase